MWVEAIIAKEDLTTILPQFTPVKIHVDGGGDLFLEDPSEIQLVANQGLRVTCKAKVHWPVLGIKVPVTLRSVTALIKPQISTKSTGDRLVFTVAIEHADFAGLPDFIDDKVTEKLNSALVREHVQLEWDFTDTLSYVFPLPATLEHVKAFGLEVAWGEVRVTEDALVLAVSFHARVVRAEASPVLDVPAESPSNGSEERLSAS